MAFIDRSQIVRNEPPDPPARGKELIAGILLVALIAAVGIRQLGTSGRAGARNRHVAVCGWPR